MDKYDVAEHACYVNHVEHKQALSNIPWTVFSNGPDPRDAQQKQQYDSYFPNQFGAWRFEEICANWRPHCVVDIRDFWMFAHEHHSPFRRLFKWFIMPTVDAPNQDAEWLDGYSQADAVFTYQDWSAKTLVEETQGRITPICRASPCADEAYHPIENRLELKKMVGLEDAYVIGTVMRNQRRKLFPDLFATFRRFLDETERKDVFLYVHTGYPDRGWNIPDLLMHHGVGSKTLFTYMCQNCGQCFPSLFQDVQTTCIMCGSPSAGLPGVKLGVSSDNMNRIMNLFDVYVQYACNEGFGMPAVEAAAAGVPVMAVDFSGMADVVRKVGGIPIKVLKAQRELESDRYTAIPDNDDLLKWLKKFFDLDDDGMWVQRQNARAAFEKNFNWDWTAKVWADAFDTVDIDAVERGWHQPPQFCQPAGPNAHENMSDYDYAAWLISEVLCDPSKVGTFIHTKIAQDLYYQHRRKSVEGFYNNELSQALATPLYDPYTREMAYNEMLALANRKNHWEKYRWEKIKQQPT